MAQVNAHMEEGYVVPALVWQAMESCGLQPERNVQFSLVFGATAQPWGDLGADTVKRSVRRYMLKQMGFAA